MAKYDVVIIGSGFGGAIPALRLAENGRRVLCLEWGRRYSARDFQHSYDLRYLLGFYVTRQSDDYTLFVRYARMLGGGSVIFSGAMYRSPSETFDYVDQQGYRVWPDAVSRKALDPYYDLVEAKLRINQVSWEQVPRSGGTFARMLAAIGASCDRGRYNYIDCKGCGFCEAGCIFDRKVTLVHTYIPEAEQRGAEFRTQCYATSLRPKGSGYEITYRDAWERETQVEADLVVLAAGAMETTALLLRSAPELPRISSQLGKNFNNNGDVALVWLLPDGFAPFHLYMGRDNAGVMCYAFWKEHRVTFHPGGPPPGVIAGLDLHRQGKLAWGLEHKQMMREYYDGRMVVALAIGLLDGKGEVGIDRAGQPYIRFPMLPHVRDYIARVEGIAQRIANSNHAELIYTAADGYEHGDAHPLACARMASDPGHGVCDAHGEVFGHPRLFVSDGASIPGGTGVNPALTIAANAERIADFIVHQR